jgi:hypothetical protein
MKPFTYHLYHKITNQHYYGVRYSKDCCPSDLWTTYFTSSPVVHTLIEEYGADSFIPAVRRVFDTARQAKAWETKFLTKINAQFNNKWLNRHNGGSTFIGPHIHSEKTKSKISAHQKGKPKSEEQKSKMRANALVREANRRANNWTMPKDAIEQAITTRTNRINSGEINPYSPERNAKMANSKKGTKRQYLPDGSFIMVKPQLDQ